MILPDLTVYGIDTAAGLVQSGGDAALYRRFLLAFAEEDAVSRLAAALEAGNAAAAFDAAHELKGLCAQLGLFRLRAQADALCSLLGGDGDPAQEAVSLARERLAPLLRARAQALRGLRALEQGA